MKWFKKLDSLFFIAGRSLLGLYFIGPRLSKVFDIGEFANNIKKSLSLTVRERKELSEESIKNVRKKYLTNMMCEKTIKLYINLLSEKQNEKNFNN